ncbi:class I SAM-dependent methyltransferase [Candidatus Gottesmanbacteria bacterium]|nr:class I SAM-dependent methyltransferase [Candidatus Gottesmanbacteria bacterium]
MSSYSLSSHYYSGVIPHPELDRWELSFYQKFFPKSVSSIVDLGCGSGEFLFLSQKIYPKSIGIDLNEGSIKTCQDKGLNVKKQNAVDTHLEEHVYDIVRAQNILEHLQNPQKLILEAKRLLKVHGFIVIHVPTNFSTNYPITNFWDDYTHVRPFTKRCLYRLLSDFNFKIIYLRGYTLGRNKFESCLGKVLEKFIPFNWFAVAKKM